MIRPTSGICPWDAHAFDRLDQVDRSVEWLSGPREVSTSTEEFVVLCVLRDAELRIEAFFRHYERLGARHFFFLDNGSKDSTVERIQRRPHATVLRSLLPYSEHYIDFMRYLTWTFGRRRWTLTADWDEFFDYPGSGQVPMGSLLRYLNGEGYNAVRTYMIDMFSDQSMDQWKSHPDDDFREKYPYCDVSDLWGVPDPFEESNTGPGRKFPMVTGGIRRTVFGTQALYLTKHALLFDGTTFQLPDQNCVSGAHVADFTGMFWHYKFLENFRTQSEALLSNWKVNPEIRGSGSVQREYAAYIEVASRNPSLRLMLPTAVRPESADQFLSADILKASDRFRSFAACAR